MKPYALKIMKLDGVGKATLPLCGGATSYFLMRVWMKLSQRNPKTPILRQNSIEIG